MEIMSYKIESDVEANHWWFVGRRKLLSRVIADLHIAPTARVLDVGTGTGTNIRLLKSLGYRNIVGIDNNSEAVRFCAEKGLGHVRKGNIYDLPFVAKEFQLILATDVIEHVDNDEKALLELKRVLASDGVLVLAAPAFHCLWGLQDEIAHHKRRYTIRQLQRQMIKAGLNCEESFYFNYLFFIPRWIMCKLMRIFRIRLASENLINTPLLNRILLAIFTLDIATARFITPPFGVSLLIVARKARDQ